MDHFSILMLIYYQNVNRIRSKTKDFFLSVLNSDYDVICLTETNLNCSVFDGELFDSRYNIVRRDRYESASHKSEGGGVLIALKKTFSFIRQISWDSEVEDLWISILPDFTSSKVINICLCYLPPDLPFEDINKFYNNLQNIVIRLRDTEEILCIGDFNTPDIQWIKSPNSNMMIASEPSGCKANILRETLDLCNLNQFNNIPNSNGRFLDLVLFSANNIQVYGAEALSREDRHHPPIVAGIDFKKSNFFTFKGKNQKRLNFFKSDFSEICSELALIDWEQLLSMQSVNDKVNAFYVELRKSLKKHTPLTTDKSHKYPVWFSPALKKCLKEKLKYFRRFKRFKNPRDYDSFSLLRARCRRLMEGDYRAFTMSVESSLNSDLKSFWRFVNNKKKNSTNIPQTMRYGNLASSDQVGVCELFSSYFCSVFEKETTGSDSETLPNRYNKILSTVEITRESIERRITKLDSSKGAGPDGIPTFVIKRCGKELSVPLCLIFNSSLQAGVFPSDWKTAHVIPIHKSGDKSRCENYRPISILSCLGKLFESLVYDALYHHIHPFLSPKQHGFVKNRSTSSNLLEYKNFLCNAFARTSQVDSVYTDFSKAFDKVNHRILGAKLASYGIHGNLLRWVESYLDNRSQLVAIKGFKSTPAPVRSGVPQGSHLGPLFFIIFINDLVDKIKCPCLLYADDLKVFSTIDSPSDSIILQSDLDYIQRWCVANRMHLNVEKCFVVSFGNKKLKLMFDYQLNGQVLQRKALARDLGVIFDEKLTFHAHYDNLISRCSKLLGFICRTTKDFKKPRSLLYLFYSLVRSILEYNAPVWSPHYAVHTNRIEGIQKRFLTILCYKQGLNRTLPSYTDKLHKFNAKSLESRRKYFDMVYLFKIIHSYIDSPALLSLININIRPRLRNPFVNTFSLQIYKNNTSYFNPVVRMCRLYNDLLSKNHMTIDLFNNNLPKFKKAIIEILSGQYCREGISGGSSN